MTAREIIQASADEAEAMSRKAMRDRNGYEDIVEMHKAHPDYGAMGIFAGYGEADHLKPLRNALGPGALKPKPRMSMVERDAWASFKHYREEARFYLWRAKHEWDRYNEGESLELAKERFAEARQAFGRIRSIRMAEKRVGRFA